MAARRPGLDTAPLKRARPVAEVAGAYGVGLRRSGRALVGRCPLHADRERPSFHVYDAPDPADDGWWCYGCGVGGDVIDLVVRVEGVGFRDAVARLTTARAGLDRAPPRAPVQRPAGPRTPDDLACLAAALDLYAGCLRDAPRALAYLAGRGIDRATARRFRLGWAAGDALVADLRRRGLPRAAAERVGLLRPDGREHLAGRVVVPELRGGRPSWLIGRAIGPRARGPVYLALPGPKPLLGWGAARSAPVVWVVEGVFDALTLRRWGLPAVALLGTHARPAVVAALRRFERVYLLLDDDPPGRAASAALAAALGARALVVPLPGVADPAELALVPGGAALLRAAAARARLAAAA